MQCEAVVAVVQTALRYLLDAFEPLVERRSMDAQQVRGASNIACVVEERVQGGHENLLSVSGFEFPQRRYLRSARYLVARKSQKYVVRA
jgi:hypothetical protein